MTNYIYHRVPNNLTGDILYPLNQLKDIYPEVYVQHSLKYEGRESLNKKIIPKLDCLWNDVLQMTAVDPKEAYDEIRKYKPNLAKDYFYKIPADILEKECTVVYLYNHPERDVNLDEQYVIEYEPEDIGKYSKLPDGTKEYYKEAIDSGKLPLLWPNVPHIFYKGTLNIEGLEIIEV